MFDTASDEDIEKGKVTDKYFERTENSLEHFDENPSVVAEITETQYANGDYKVFTGLKEVANLLEGLELDMYAIEEGRMFNGGPVVKIEGDYLEFARLETSILGILSQNSGFATKANEIRMSTDKKVLSFGGRHVHPSIANLVDRNCMIAGFDGFSIKSAEEIIGKESSGTMPHALVLSYNDNRKAFRAFNEAVDENVPRIPICDTFNDEIEEVKDAVRELGEDLDGVRLDTTSSRRGDFERIIKEIRWELEKMGREDVKIFVSGGITVDSINDLEEVVDGFGVGSYVSDANPLDFGLDIVERNGEDISKRGKLSGKKTVHREDNKHRVDTAENVDKEEIMKPVIKDGEIIMDFSVEKARNILNTERKNLNLDDN
jgi:nicotinate phosphoribosyltransferase